MQNLAKRDGDFWQSSILSNFNCSLMFLSSLSSCFAASADLIALSRGDLRSSSFPDITTSSSYSAHTHAKYLYLLLLLYKIITQPQTPNTEVMKYETAFPFCKVIDKCRKKYYFLFAHQHKATTFKHYYYNIIIITIIIFTKTRVTSLYTQLSL